MAHHDDKLVKMANDIGNFFASDPDQASAVRGMVDHLRKFWEPRMRKAIVLHYRAGGAGLSEVASLAVKQLAEDYTSLSEVGDG